MRGEGASGIGLFPLGGWTARALRFPRKIITLPRDLRYMYFSNMSLAFGIGLYSNAWPIYLQNNLGADPIVVGYLLSLGVFVLTAIFPVGGLLADRWDRRRVLLLGAALQALAPLVYFAASTWWQLIPGIVMFYCSALATPAFIAYLSDSVTPEEEMEAFGFFYTSGPLGFFAAPLVGAGLVSLMPFRFIFLPVCALLTAAFLLLVPIRSMRPRSRGKIALTPSRGAWARIALLALAAAPFSLGAPFYPLLLKDEGFAQAQVLALGSVSALGMIVLSWSLGRLANMGPRRTPMALCNVAFIVLAVATLSPAPLLLAPMAFLLGAPSASRSLADPIIGRLREEGKGWTLSLYLSVENLGAAVAILIGGYLYAGDRVYPFVLAIPFLVIISALFFMYPSMVDYAPPPTPTTVPLTATLGAVGADHRGRSMERP